MGDFNADFKRRFGQELRTFANESELHISDGILHGFDSDFYTYISVKRIRLSLGWITLCVPEQPIGTFYLVVYWMT